jgi:hypothetical protein
MTKKKKGPISDPLIEQTDLLSTLLIVQLLQAGVAQNKIAQLLRKPKRKGKK